MLIKTPLFNLANAVCIHRGVGQGARALPARLLLLAACCLLPIAAHSDGTGWSAGLYGGQYYDTEPAGILEGNARFEKQYLVAITASKTVWSAEALPASVEIDGMIGHQSGRATLNEIAVSPALKWSGFPWSDFISTRLRLAPLGISYTSSISPLERGTTSGKGSQLLNALFIDLGFALPRAKSEEVFVRLHHRCTIYNLLNNYGANGEDFIVAGYRHYY